MKRLFLGGTCGENPWRDPYISTLTNAGVLPEQIFNPVLPPGTWNDEAKAAEDAVKADPQAIMLFHLTDPRSTAPKSISVYSYIQLLFSFYRKRNRTAVMFDTFEDAGVQKSIKAIEMDIINRFGSDVVLPNFGSAVDYIISEGNNNPLFAFFLSGTCGNNPMRQRLIDTLVARNFSRNRLFDPNVGPEGWSENTQFLEDQAMLGYSHTFCYIGDPMEDRPNDSGISLYSGVEALSAAFDDPNRVVITCNPNDFSGYAKDAVEKMLSDFQLHLPNLRVYTKLEESIEPISQLLK